MPISGHSALLDRFTHAVGGLAALHAYPYPERQAQWLQRLGINAPELDALLQASPRTDLAYLQPPVAMPSQGGVPIRAGIATGMADLAYQHRQNPAVLVRNVKAAWHAAQQASKLNVFISLASRSMLDEQLAGLPQGADVQAAPLLGVPIAVKDLMRVKGHPMTGGSGGVPPAPETQDAQALARLRQAGAVVLGTTNLHELAYGITSENPHYGWVGNPRYPGCMAGGSSGGSAAAVAAGIVRMAVGSDTSGSIRIPAACCGVVGFKPSFDAVPRAGAMTLCSSLDHIGALAASVPDAALAFSVMAGMPASVPDVPAHLRGVRVGIPRAYFFEPLAPEVATAVEHALTRLQRDGAQLVPVDIVGMAQCAAIQFATLCSEATHQHWDRLCQQPETLGEDVRVRLEIGQFLPARWYVHAQHLRADLVQAMTRVMHGIDVLATPTLRITPPASGQVRVVLNGADVPIHPAMIGLTLPFNLSGMPAISLPCQRPGHRPVGIQLAGKMGDDWRVLNLAARLEQLLEMD